MLVSPHIEEYRPYLLKALESIKETTGVSELYITEYLINIYAEGYWMSYIPKSLLVPMCESLGFEVVYTKEVRGEGTAISWVELKKSGTLETVKAHQVLGEINAITI